MTDPQKKQSWFYRFNLIIEKYSPDAFVFAVLLTIVVLILSQVATDTSLEASVIAWGNGLHGLMAFSFQMAFIICAAFVLAHTTAVSKLLSMLGSLPQSTNQAYILVILCTAMFSLLIWPMGLIAGGLISKEVARNASNRNISVHYPLLIAAAFGGFIVWHMGYSSSIGLAIATQGNPLEQQIGEIIPVTETLLTWWNILTIFITLAVVSVTIILLHPKKSIELPSTSENQSISNEIPVDRRPGIMGLLEHSRITSTILSIMLFAYIGLTFYKNGLDLNLNVVNWSFLALGLLLVKSSAHYYSLFSQGAKTGAAVLLQYPLYGGMMGLMMNSGLTQQFSEIITQVSSAETLPFFGFISAGIVNLAIPSGGAQWALQGPIFIEAAHSLGVDIRIIAMSIAWGDQWTNIIQPFVAIPLIAMAGVKLRQIYSYCLILLCTTFFAFNLGLFLATTAF